MQELIINENNIKDKFHNIRNQQVMLNRDLAELYHVGTRKLNEQVKRNIERFPEEFMFQLSKEEFFSFPMSTLGMQINILNFFFYFNSHFWKKGDRQLFH